MRPGLLLLILTASAGCGDGPSGDASDVDSSFVEVLADIHLADARAALDSTGRDRQALADSLRTAALASHDLDSAALADCLDRLAQDPERLRAIYDALEARLALERQGGF